jgi:hypothetical protein
LSPILCPNCGAPVEGAPVSCGLCGYRSELASEYFWLYGGGGLVTLLGFVLGAMGVAGEGARPDHWSARGEGWFPFWPWPAGYHWLSFLVAGIAFTLVGIGITRRRPAAWLGLVLLSAYQAALAALALAGVRGPPGSRGAAVPPGARGAAGARLSPHAAPRCPPAPEGYPRRGTLRRRRAASP